MTETPAQAERRRRLYSLVYDCGMKRSEAIAFLDRVAQAGGR